MKIYKIASKPFRYLGQCDQIRCNNTENETKWRTMMEKQVKVPMEEFMLQCDWKELVDEDENNLDNFGHSDLYVAKSIWGDQECYFLATGGFEFIFVKP